MAERRVLLPNRAKRLKWRLSYTVFDVMNKHSGDEPVLIQRKRNNQEAGRGS